LKKRLLVETDFLFGLSSRDSLYPIVMELLKRRRSGDVK